MVRARLRSGLGIGIALTGCAAALYEVLSSSRRPQLQTFNEEVLRADSVKVALAFIANSKVCFQSKNDQVSQEPATYQLTTIIAFGSVFPSLLLYLDSMSMIRVHY